MRIRHSVCLLAVGSFCAVHAFAHVGLLPRRGVSGTHHEAFSVRAPVEKEIPTVELKIEIPSEWKEAGGQVDRVEHNPNWKIEIERDEDDWIKTVRWYGNEAPDYSFIQFGLIITLPELEGMQQIKAWQKYSDGSVVAWIEDRNEEGTENPAAALMLHEGREGGTSMVTLGLSGLIGGLLGAGLILIAGKNGHKSHDS
jgi:uncharacterized protein YcnI